MTIRQNHFISSPERVLFWEEQRILLIADAHFAKEMHFRKSGIAIPGGILRSDLQRIDQLIQQFSPRELLFLGDMFHSEENEGLSEFMQWRKKQSCLISLVIGNHDILDQNWYTFAGINCHSGFLQREHFIFSHDRLILDDESLYNFSGHIHPGIIMYGKAKQSLRLPCFWFGKFHAVLPAFGRFTGSRSVKAEKNDTIIAIGENELFRMEFQEQ